MVVFGIFLEDAVCDVVFSKSIVNTADGKSASIIFHGVTAIFNE